MGTSARYRDRRHGAQLGEFPEDLGDRGEEELVSGALGPSQAQAVELQDAFEVGEQHLDLLPLSS